jgi:hypothetical protein
MTLHDLPLKINIAASQQITSALQRNDVNLRIISKSTVSKLISVTSTEKSATRVLALQAV